MLFVRDTLPQLRKNHPDVSISQVGIMMGAMWRDMSGTEREPYHAGSALEVSKFKREMELYKVCCAMRDQIDNK